MRLACSILALCLAACGGSSDCTVDNATGTSTITLQGTAFVPSCVKITKANQMTFKNQDSMVHTVTSAGAPDVFDSGDVPATTEFKHTFSNEGTVTLRCNYHSVMKATVFVVK